MPKFVNLSPNEEQDWIAEEQKFRRGARLKQVREKEKKHAEERRNIYHEIQLRKTFREEYQAKLEKLAKAKQELLQLKQFKENAFKAGPRVEAPLETVSELSVVGRAVGSDCSPTTNDVLPISNSQALPNNVFGKGFLRSDELREAAQIENFVASYKQDQREQAKKERFKIAYEKRVLAEKQKIQQEREEVERNKVRVGCINTRRKMDLRAKEMRRKMEQEKQSLSDEKLLMNSVMCHDTSGYVDYSQTRFHVVKNTEDLQQELDAMVIQRAAEKPAQAETARREKMRQIRGQQAIRKEREARENKKSEIVVGDVERLERQSSVGKIQYSVDRSTAIPSMPLPKERDDSRQLSQMDASISSQQAPKKSDTHVDDMIEIASSNSYGKSTAERTSKGTAERTSKGTAVDGIPAKKDFEFYPELDSIGSIDAVDFLPPSRKFTNAEEDEYDAVMRKAQEILQEEEEPTPKKQNIRKAKVTPVTGTGRASSVGKSKGSNNPEKSLGSKLTEGSYEGSPCDIVVDDQCEVEVEEGSEFLGSSDILQDLDNTDALLGNVEHVGISALNTSFSSVASDLSFKRKAKQATEMLRHNDKIIEDIRKNVIERNASVLASELEMSSVLRSPVKNVHSPTKASSSVKNDFSPTNYDSSLVKDNNSLVKSNRRRAGSASLRGSREDGLRGSTKSCEQSSDSRNFHFYTEESATSSSRMNSSRLNSSRVSSGQKTPGLIDGSIRRVDKILQESKADIERAVAAATKSAAGSTPAAASSTTAHFVGQARTGQAVPLRDFAKVGKFAPSAGIPMGRSPNGIGNRSTPSSSVPAFYNSGNQSNSALKPGSYSVKRHSIDGDTSEAGAVVIAHSKLHDLLTSKIEADEIDYDNPYAGYGLEAKDDPDDNPYSGSTTAKTTSGNANNENNTTTNSLRIVSRGSGARNYTLGGEDEGGVCEGDESSTTANKNRARRNGSYSPEKYSFLEGDLPSTYGMDDDLEQSADHVVPSRTDIKISQFSPAKSLASPAAFIEGPLPGEGRGGGGITTNGVTGNPKNAISASLSVTRKPILHEEKKAKQRPQIQANADRFAKDVQLDRRKIKDISVLTAELDQLYNEL